jgi:hypothetical protein
MPQVVEANSAHACFGDEFIEEAVQISRLDDRADFEVKTRPESTQAGQAQGLRQPDLRGGFGAPSLRPQEAELCDAACSTLEDRTAHLGQPLHVLPDVEHTTFEVDVVPTKGEQLALP